LWIDGTGFPHRNVPSSPFTQTSLYGPRFTGLALRAALYGPRFTELP
jgi:hypothetical protein